MKGHALGDDFCVQVEPDVQTRSQMGPQLLSPAIVVGALGVVFGDIGTSPIYTIQTVFNPEDPHPVPISVDNVYGVVSTVFWSVMIVVTLTYITHPLSSGRHQRPAIVVIRGDEKR